MGTTQSSVSTPADDVLSYLPVSSVVEFRKGEVIYGPEPPPSNLYLTVAGKVKLSQMTDDGDEVLLEIIRTDELFGQSSFLAGSHRSERAVAMEPTRVMLWPIATVEDLVMKRPRLAVALLQILAERTLDFARRIESFSVDNVEKRLARSLLRFAERLGSKGEDGSVRMMAFTHEMLSRHVGTSREVVTQYMNQFRKRGYLRYSRQEIVLYRDALASMMQTTPAAAQATATAGAEPDENWS